MKELIGLGIILVLVGFFLILIGSLSYWLRGEAKGGFTLLLGPFPIIGATDKQTFYLLLFLTILFFLLFILLQLKK